MSDQISVGHGQKREDLKLKVRQQFEANQRKLAETCERRAYKGDGFQDTSVAFKDAQYFLANVAMTIFSRYSVSVYGVESISTRLR